jgi:hypothetical protein
MKIRGKRYLVGLAAVLLVVIGVLAVLEWGRRRQVAAAGPETLDGSGRPLSAQDLQEKYRDPAAFAELCADVRERCDALRKRFLDLQHTRKARLIEYDRKGQEVSVMEIIDRVHFEGETEKKEEIERRQLLGKPFPFDPDMLRAEHPTKKAVPAFSKDAPEGLYRYRLEGAEELHDRLVLRIHFEPTERVERSFKGWAWVDPVTREPVRIHGSLVKTPLLVDRFEMLLDYGPSENGHNQIRHAIIDVAGGFAVVSRHYRIESELKDYRMARSADR